MAAGPVVRVSGPWNREGRRREAALLAASVAIDAVAAGILLFGTSLPQPLEGLSVVVSHGTAALLLSGLARARPSRRWLGVAAVVAVPLAGAAVAAAILVTRGRGPTAMARPRRARRRPALALTAVRRLGGALSPCEALLCGDEDQRRAALSALSRREDPEAIALLRRAAASPDPDLALSAALVLDEIGERAERRTRQLDRLEVRHGAG